MVTMRKGTQTRNDIVAKAAPLFNKHGYTGVSMSDIMAVTALKKGGIYNHFGSKEELMFAAFDYALRRVRRRFVEALRGTKTPRESLEAILGVMARYVQDPPVQGGCPILNTAIESDDTHPALRARARQGMDELLDYITITVQQGVDAGSFHPHLDANHVASVFIAMLEGALMLSKLYGTTIHMDVAVQHLRHYIGDQLIV